MDQELRDLVLQIQDLVPVLKDMSKRPGETAGSGSNRSADNMTRGVDRIVVALGQLTAKLDTTKRTKLAEEEAVKQFTKSVEKTTEALDKENKASAEREKEKAESDRRSKMSQSERDKEDRERAAKRDKDEQTRLEQKAKQDIERSARETREKANELRKGESVSAQMFESFSASGTASDLLKTKFFDLAGNSMGAQAGLRVVAAGAEGAAKSLKTFSTGLLNGERGAQLSAKALTDFATPLLQAADVLGGILSVASFFLPGGPIIKFGMRAGAALLGLGSAAGAATLKLNELGAKQLDTLMKSFNDLSGAGINLTTGLEGTLGLMHTLNLTTAEAAQLNEIIGKSSKQLAQMGGTAAMGAERFAKVAGGLVKSGLGEEFERMGITQQEQREAALLYMSIQAKTGQLQLKNIQQLTEESGKFVQELDMAAQLTGTTRKQQQEAEITAMTEPRFRAALIDARQRGDTEYQQQLLIAKRTFRILQTLGDEKGALGVLQQAAGRGALPTAEARAAESSYRISEILAQPNITDQQILATLTKNGQVTQQQLSMSNALVANIDALQTSIVGIDEVVLRGTTLIEESAKAGFKGPEDITKYLEEQEKKRKQPGGSLALMTSAGRAQQAAAMTMEAGINTFNVAAELNNTASKAFADAVKKFGDIMGVKVAGGTPTFGGVPVESGVRLPPTVAAATAKVEKAKDTIKELDVKIKEQEEKLKLAKTNVEKDQAEAEIKKLKSQLSDANKAKNAAELGQRSLENRNRLGEANQRLKSGGGPLPLDSKGNPIGGGVTGQKPTTSPTKILDLIGRAESGGNYNILVGGKTNPELTNMTISEVLGYQSNMLAQGHESTAVGKYQIVQGTLQGLLKQGVVSPNERFSPSTQDKLATALLNEKGWANFQSGNMSVDQMADAIAQVWAGFPLASGRSFYQGVGSNKATVGRQEVLSALTDAPKARNGGVFQGPLSGYPAVLHGKEAVIPLKNGAVPVMMPALDELVSSNRAVDAQVQVLRNEMKSIMSELTNAMTSMKESGSQQRMIELLESISRSQQTTATASSRMAQLAAN